MQNYLKLIFKGGMATACLCVVAGFCLQKTPVASNIVYVRLNKGHSVPCQCYVSDRIRGAGEYREKILSVVFHSVYVGSRILFICGENYNFLLTQQHIILSHY